MLMLILVDVLLFIGVIVLIVVIEIFDKKGLTASLVLLTMIASALLLEICDTKHVQAINVYRGETTLKITYVDSIPVDTTVVWKKDYK